MANKKWSKLPRNIIYSKEFQDVLKELPEELIYKAYTFLLSCYCNADDDGVIYIEEFKNYAEKILLSPYDLRKLINSFCKNGMLHRFTVDIDIFALCNWELPVHKNSHKKESIEERRNRISKWAETTCEGYPPQENHTIKVNFS